MFVDSDDVLMPDIVKMLHCICCEYDADMASCSILKKSGDKVTVPKKSSDCKNVEIFEGDSKMSAYIRDRKLRNTVWGTLYSAELFCDIRFPAGRLYEDVFTMHRIVHKARRIAKVGYEGYIYRQHPESITKQVYSDRQVDIIHSRQTQLDFIREYYPELEPYSVTGMLQGCRGLTLRLATAKKRHRDV